MEFQAKTTSNPLSMFMRQPKIFIRLPSNGAFWPEGSLQTSETGEFPVYAMTAKDELALKIPDALMNGQAVVDVIENCVPNIKNAWHTPSIDLDYILIAIRIATYGEMMTVPVSDGKDIDLEYDVDLRIVMDQLLSQIHWDETVPITDELTVFVKPISYKQMANAAIQTFEAQKIIRMVNDESIDEDTKLQIFKESFAKLTKNTLAVIANSISRVDSVHGSTENPEHILEFVSNVEKPIFKKIESHLEHLKEINTVKPLKVSVTEEMRAAGITGDVFEIPLTFDPSTFFV